MGKGTTNVVDVGCLEGSKLALDLLRNAWHGGRRHLVLAQSRVACTVVPKAQSAVFRS